MQIYVDGRAQAPGDGTRKRPFTRIQEAADAARPGDEVLVAPGVYRERVNPKNAGREAARITYRSIEPRGAVITGAEEVKDWKPCGGIWTASVDNSLFGDYNPYTTYVYGDWYFAGKSKHTGAVYLNGEALYEAGSVEECREGAVYECSWDPEHSRRKWYAEQQGTRTVFYINIGDADPAGSCIEINVRRNCFLPSETGIDYITVSGFTVTQAATTWAPPAAYQDGMIGPHWAKGWIIEDCEISNSKCAGISVGKYLDPENEHYFTYKRLKSPTQMERDAVCRGQYHGWTKERIGGHIIRRNDIHHCQQGGIIGRMGGVFSLIEDNHIHHINNMMELGGAEIAGIKLHAAIDVVIRHNHIHHCTMGIWTDWEAQGTRITGNLLHDNQRPPFAKQLKGGMMSQDIFVEVSHGPTLIDNNLLLSDVSLRMATQGVAMVHNLICGAFTSVGENVDSVVEGKLRQRYTPYHIPHRTEVMGFMTILHGDDRFYNNIFVQRWPRAAASVVSDTEDAVFTENREVGTHVLDAYPDYETWHAQFFYDDGDTPDMKRLEPAHFRPLPVWAGGNAYLAGAFSYRNECIVSGDGKASDAPGRGSIRDDAPVRINLAERDGRIVLETDLYERIGEFRTDAVETDTLGRAFEPEQRYENPDGSAIVFDTDFLGGSRGVPDGNRKVLPGPFAAPSKEQIVW